jgi:hypothetical protein
VQGFVLLKRYKVGLGVGFCNSVSVKSAAQKKAVGSAKNGGRGLEKKPYPYFRKKWQESRKFHTQ